MQKIFLAIGFVFIAVASKGQKVLQEHLMDTTLCKPIITEAEPKQPEFPGGNEALFKFLTKNQRYPVEAREKNIQGKEVVEFVINEDGSLSNAHIINDIGGGCAEETLRILSLMPNWIPPKVGGEPTCIIMRFPFTFKLASK